MAISLKVNGASHSTPAEPDTPLLYVLRNDLFLAGAKFGCGLAQCGACTVLVDGKATRSCVTPIGTLGNSEITTIEGLGTIEKPHPLQKAFIDEQAAQCGYCINGMIMKAKELLDQQTAVRPMPTCARRWPAISAAAEPTTGSSPRSCGPAKRAGGWANERSDPDTPRLHQGAWAAWCSPSRSTRPNCWPRAQPPRLPGSLNNNRSLQAWMRIGGDGNATVYTGKVELGQGILTALWQIAAEELDLAPSRVRIFSADTALSPDEGQTAGSQSIENSGTALRLACAEVRAMLVDLAAEKLGVPANSLTVTDGVISTADRPQGHLCARSPRSSISPARRPARSRRNPRRRTRSSASRRRALDIPGKVTGRISYVQDIFEAGMVHGRVVRPPRYGSTLESVDDAAVSKMPGVIKVVRDGSFLGVVAEREEQAIKAREALAKAAKWKLGPELPDPANIHAHLKSLPNKTEVIGVKQAPALAAANTAHARGHLHQAVSGRMARSARPARWRHSSMDG